MTLWMWSLITVLSPETVRFFPDPEAMTWSFDRLVGNERISALVSTNLSDYTMVYWMRASQEETLSADTVVQLTKPSGEGFVIFKHLLPWRIQSGETLKIYMDSCQILHVIMDTVSSDKAFSLIKSKEKCEGIPEIPKDFTDREVRAAMIVSSLDSLRDLRHILKVIETIKKRTKDGKSDNVEVLPTGLSIKGIELYREQRTHSFFGRRTYALLILQGKSLKRLQNVCSSPPCWGLIADRADTLILWVQVSDSAKGDVIPVVQEYKILLPEVKLAPTTRKDWFFLTLNEQYLPYYPHRVVEIAPLLHVRDGMAVKTVTDQDSQYHLFKVEPFATGWRGIKLLESRNLQKVRILVGNQDGLWAWDTVGFLYGFFLNGGGKRKFFSELSGSLFVGYTGLWSGSRNLVREFLLIGAGGEGWIPRMTPAGEISLEKVFVPAESCPVLYASFDGIALDCQRRKDMRALKVIRLNGLSGPSGVQVSPETLAEIITSVPLTPVLSPLPVFIPWEAKFTCFNDKIFRKSRLNEQPDELLDAVYVPTLSLTALLVLDNENEEPFLCLWDWRESRARKVSDVVAVAVSPQGGLWGITKKHALMVWTTGGFNDGR